MTVFQIIIVIGLLAVIAGVSAIIWILRQTAMKPKTEAVKQAQQAVEVEIEQAKVILDAYEAETRMDSIKKTVGSAPDLDKLRGLRRKK